jgi:predicted ABC-type ATPase
MRELTETRANFGFETTLAGRSYVQQFENWRGQGYRIVLFFLWLPDVELAIARVAQRVQEGGHHVPAADIRRRFTAGIQNFWNLYRPRLDVWRLYDASHFDPTMIAYDEGERVVERPVEFEQFTQSAAN